MQRDISCMELEEHFFERVLLPFKGEPFIILRHDNINDSVSHLNLWKNASG